MIDTPGPAYAKHQGMIPSSSMPLKYQHCPSMSHISMPFNGTTDKTVLIHSRSQESQAMVDRITDEVNGILCQEAGAPSLSKQAVLDLIDQGASQGGPQAGPA